jgi:hypothetical protein
LPIVASPSLFLKMTDLSQFQAVNDPSSPLVLMPPGEQEQTFLRVAETIYDLADAVESRGQQVSLERQTSAQERFLEHEVWTRLIKIGNWIFDEERSLIIGSGVRAYLLSRHEYGDAPFTLQARLQFSNFLLPQGDRLGMNAGIVFGWKAEGQTNRYYNILLTGTELLVERVGFKGGSEGRDYEHVTAPAALPIESGKLYCLEVRVDADRVDIDVDGRHIQSLDRPTGVTGRVGSRPWRSQVDCTLFIVTTR